MEEDKLTPATGLCVWVFLSLFSQKWPLLSGDGLSLETSCDVSICFELNTESHFVESLTFISFVFCSELLIWLYLFPNVFSTPKIFSRF